MANVPHAQAICPWPRRRPRPHRSTVNVPGETITLTAMPEAGSSALLQEFSEQPRITINGAERQGVAGHAAGTRLC
jgi:hypothetical protein